MPVETVLQVGDDKHHIEVRGNFAGKDASDYILSPESEHLLVNLPSFGGPLDLLLHLIKKHSMDIFDIPIVAITKKYLDILEEMRTLNLDIAGEFLLMAATLTEIKSRMLLPPDEQAAEDEEAGVDPRAELVRRLLEYQRFKEIAATLKARGHLGSDVFFRHLDPDMFEGSDFALSIHDEAIPLAPVEVYELIKLFAHTLERAQPKVAHAITLEKVSVRARINEMIEFSRLRVKYLFTDAVRFFGEQTKGDIILTFLAVLEMTRLKLLKVQQTGDGDIAIEANADNLWASESDMMADLNDDTLPV